MHQEAVLGSVERDGRGIDKRIHGEGLWAEFSRERYKREITSCVYSLPWVRYFLGMIFWGTRFLCFSGDSPGVAECLSCSQGLTRVGLIECEKWNVIRVTRLARISLIFFFEAKYCYFVSKMGLVLKQSFCSGGLYLQVRKLLKFSAELAQELQEKLVAEFIAETAKSTLEGEVREKR